MKKQMLWVGQLFLLSLSLNLIAFDEIKSSNNDFEESVQIFNSNPHSSCCRGCWPCSKKDDLFLIPNPQNVQQYGTLTLKEDDNETLIGCCCCTTTRAAQEGEALTACQSFYRKFWNWTNEPCHPLMIIPGLIILTGLGVGAGFLYYYYPI